MAALPRNNAFGIGSPSWNLPFPVGSITAAEILAYLPHWLKSLDVIDRFVTNGARSVTIAAVVNEFRYQPTNVGFPSNSAQIMMSYAMRRAGYKKWTFRTHKSWSRETELPENDLSVEGFRPPRLTHPRKALSVNTEVLRNNHEAKPVRFRDLAVNVKEHPSGADALDLTRCVLYALDNENEEWLFPDDFARLVIHLGGPAQITHAHHDRQIFSRRDKNIADTTSKKRKAAEDSRRPRAIMNHIHIGSAITAAVTRVRSATPRETPQKRLNEDLGRVQSGTKRRSGRLAGKAFNLREDSDDETTDKDLDSPVSHFTTPTKRRKLTRVPPTPKSTSNDSDFIDDVSEPDDDIPEEEDATDDDIASPTLAPRGRAAARKARANIQSSFLDSRTTLIPKVAKVEPRLKKAEPQHKPAYMSTVVGPEVMKAVKHFAQRQPVWLAPPTLSADRLKVDASSIYLYAADGCSTFAEMWESALSSSRFRGPRRHAPFRELHRLSDPHPSDASDWAENIRWAKEQYKAFGSETWTEYDYHLECITDHRREMMWVSEEAIMIGM